MLKEYPKITLYKGATSVVRFDLSNVNMNEGYFVFTMKAKKSNDVLKQFVFNEKKIYDVTFEDDFTKDLIISCDYYYDIMYHVGEERFPQCLPSKIEIKKTIGGLDSG